MEPIINPFVNNGDTPFFRGGRRQEILQYIRHLCENLYDIVFLAGPQGSGKSALLQAFASELNDDVVTVVSFDAAEYALDEGWKKLCHMVGPQVLCVDNAHRWKEQDFIALLEKVAVAGANPQRATPLKCILSIDPRCWEPAKEWDVVQKLSRISYQVDLLPFKHLELQKYLQFRLNVAGIHTFHFTRREIDLIAKRSSGIPAAVNEQAAKVYAARKNALPSWWLLFPKTHWAGMTSVALLMGWLVFGELDSQNHQKDSDTVSLVVDRNAPDVLPNDNVKASSTTVTQPTVTIAEDHESEQIEPHEEAVKPVLLAADPSELDQFVEHSNIPQHAHPDETVEKIEPLKTEAVNTVAAKVEAVKAKSSIAIAAIKPPVKTEDSEISVQQTPEQFAAGKYVIQLVAGQSLPDIKRLQKKYEELYGLSVTRHQRSAPNDQWYVLVTGGYVTSTKAREAVSQLPDSLQAAKPWVRSREALLN